MQGALLWHMCAAAHAGGLTAHMPGASSRRAGRLQCRGRVKEAVCEGLEQVQLATHQTSGPATPYSSGWSKRSDYSPLQHPPVSITNIGSLRSFSAALAPSCGPQKGDAAPTVTGPPTSWCGLACRGSRRPRS